MIPMMLIGGCLLLSAGIVSGQSLLTNAEFPAQYRPNGTPFTVTVISRKYGPDGKLGGQEHITYSVRSDRRMSKSLRRFNDDGKMMVNNTRLLDPGRNLEILADHFTQSTHHSMLPDHAHDIPTAAEVASLATASSSLLGYTALKIETEHSLPSGGTVTQESWIAPELDNFPLRTETTWNHDGTTLRSETEVTSIVPEALPEEAFQVPEGYVERLPSEHAKLLMDRLGEPQLPSSLTSSWDKRYLKRLPPSMKSLVRSRPALSDSRRPGETRRVTRETPGGSGEGLKTEVSEDLSGPSKSDRPNLFARLLFLGICLIVVSGVLLVRRYHLRIREPRV